MDKIGINTIQGCLATSRAAFLLYLETGVLGCNSVSAYLIQQTAEKLIKIQIPADVFMQMTEKETSKFRTHNLKMLIKLFDKYHWPLIGNKFFSSNDALVSSWNTKGRYEEDFYVEKDMLDQAHHELIYWFDHVKRFYVLNPPKNLVNGKLVVSQPTFKEFKNIDKVLLDSIYPELSTATKGGKKNEGDKNNKEYVKLKSGKKEKSGRTSRVS